MRRKGWSHGQRPRRSARGHRHADDGRGRHGQGIKWMLLVARRRRGDHRQWSLRHIVGVGIWRIIPLFDKKMQDRFPRSRSFSNPACLMLSLCRRRHHACRSNETTRMYRSPAMGKRRRCQSSLSTSSFVIIWKLFAPNEVACTRFRFQRSGTSISAPRFQSLRERD
jgi:hypothetical protein